MKQRFLTFIAVALVLLAMLPSSAFADTASTGVLAPGARPLSPNYAAVKAELDAQMAQGVAVESPAGNVPTSLVKWKGLGPNNFSPSDATGAVGPDRYIEVVNVAIAVYDRTGHLLSTNPESTWTGFGTAASGDGQIMYDVHDQRFYYAMLYISGSSNQLGFGFSKTSTPSANASDWCSYHSTFGVYGTAFPDYPKLGQTSDFLLIGVNRFSSSIGNYVASDVAWSTKPATGTITTCPALNSLTTGVQQSLRNADNSLASTPVPGRQTDDGGTGYVVANHDVSGGGSATALSVFTVTKNTTTGAPVFSSAATVTVASYSMPPDAPQSGTTFTLDTLDGRLTTAWLAPDPNQGGALALWTQQTVAASTGGLGAEDRWYEINPATATLFQHGIAHSATQYAFMGAIAPDRNGATGQFGGDMVMVFNTSSTTQVPEAEMISKVGAAAQSHFVLVMKSTRSDTEFTCSQDGGICRWGDYAGASPEPASTTNGEVWNSIMLSNGGTSSTAAWATVNWAAKP